jgi:hypothetical protein
MDMADQLHPHPPPQPPPPPPENDVEDLAEAPLPKPFEVLKTES